LAIANRHERKNVRPSSRFAEPHSSLRAHSPERSAQGLYRQLERPISQAISLKAALKTTDKKSVSVSLSHIGAQLRPRRRTHLPKAK
jgi:hypothetical protein